MRHAIEWGDCCFVPAVHKLRLHFILKESFNVVLFKAHLFCYFANWLSFSSSTCFTLSYHEQFTVESGTDVTCCLSKEISDSLFCSAVSFICYLLNSCHVLLPQCFRLNGKLLLCMQLVNQNLFFKLSSFLVESFLECEGTRLRW